MGKRPENMTVIPRDANISQDRAGPALSYHPDLIWARIKNFSGLEKKNWFSLEAEIQEDQEEIYSSITGSVKNKQYWKAHERVCVCVIRFLQENRVKSLSKV